MRDRRGAVDRMGLLDDVIPKYPLLSQMGTCSINAKSRKDLSLPDHSAQRLHRLASLRQRGQNLPRPVPTDHVTRIRVNATGPASLGVTLQRDNSRTKPQSPRYIGPTDKEGHTKLDVLNQERQQFQEAHRETLQLVESTPKSPIVVDDSLASKLRRLDEIGNRPLRSSSCPPVQRAAPRRPRAFSEPTVTQMDEHVEEPQAGIPDLAADRPVRSTLEPLPLKLKRRPLASWREQGRADRVPPRVRSVMPVRTMLPYSAACDEADAIRLQQSQFYPTAVKPGGTSTQPQERPDTRGSNFSGLSDLRELEGPSKPTPTAQKSVLPWYEPDEANNDYLPIVLGCGATSEVSIHNAPIVWH